MASGPWGYSYVGLWALLLLEGVLLFGLIRQMVRLYEHWIINDPDWGLPLGSLAPALPVKDLFGRPVSLAAARGKKTLLLFLSRGCKACRDTLALVPSMPRGKDKELVLVIAERDPQVASFVAELNSETGVPRMPVIADGDRQIM